MVSTFACLGLDVVDTQEEFGRFTGRLAAQAVPIGLWGGVTVARWQDPSGVRLTFALRGREILDFVPGFDGPAGGWFSAFRPLNESVVSVSVDEDGEQATGMAVEMEERHLLPAWPDLAAPVAITALGVDAKLYADEQAFADSDDSLLSPGSDPGRPPPDGPVAIQWPPRVGAESFFSYGVFADAAEADSHARLSGIVQGSERRIVELTGQSIVVCRVRTVGFEANVCLPGATDDPQHGQVLSGTVWLSASLPSPPRLPRRRWWRRS